MQPGVNNPVLLSLKSNFDKSTSKKQLKPGWKIEYHKVGANHKIIDTYANNIETEVIGMMLDSIDWGVVITAHQFIQTTTNSKEKGRVHMLSEMIKDLCVKPNFLDFFAEALEKTQKKKIILKNFDEIMKGLELTIVSKITIGLSMVLSSDEAIKQKGLSYFKLRFKEYFELGKPVEIPEYLLTTVIRFVKTNEQMNLPPEEINFWIESQKGFKSPQYEPLSLVVNPAEAFSDDFQRLGPVDLSSIDARGSLKELLLELGPMVVQDEEFFK